MSKIPKEVVKDLERTDDGKKALARMRAQIKAHPNAKFTVTHTVKSIKNGSKEETINRVLAESPLKEKREKALNPNKNCEDC